MKGLGRNIVEREGGLGSTTSLVVECSLFVGILAPTIINDVPGLVTIRAKGALVKGFAFLCPIHHLRSAKRSVGG